MSQNKRVGSARLSVYALEAMERRVLLSSTALMSTPWLPIATQGVQTYQSTADDGTVRTYADGQARPSVGVITPAQMRGAYGMTGLTINGIAGNGAGQTIAILAGFHNPNAYADLLTFDSYYGLANPPGFQQVNAANGNPVTATNTPGDDPTGVYSVEESLDIQWAHVMAPQASIVVVEMDLSNDFSDSQFINTLSASAARAASLPGVSVVSMSFGADEFSGETAYDGSYTTPSGHQGVTFIASAGDAGIYSDINPTTVIGSYPATSPNVVAVGGTTLTVTGTGYGGERAWGYGTNSGSAGGGGGGVSPYESAPAFATFVSGSFGGVNRAYPDLSLDADPNSGVAVVDSYSTGSSTEPWISGAVGGTSLAAPLFAGMMAVVNQGRAQNGLVTLDGPTQTLPHLYESPLNGFHDITTGSNGDPAGPGFDLATGRGSPIAGTLLADLASNYIGYHVFDDINVDGIQEAGEAGLAGITVALESTAGVVLQTTTTDAGGFYQFLNRAPGSYLVHFTAPSGFQISPLGNGTSLILESTADPSTGNAVATISANNNGAGTTDFAYANCGMFSETISITDQSIQRPQSGTANMTFTVTISPSSPNTTFSVPYTTVDGVAQPVTAPTGAATVAHNDYRATSGTLVFAPGVTTETITVVIVGNTLIERNLIFTVQLSPPASQFDLIDSKTTGTGTIVNTSFPAVSTAVTAGDTLTRSATVSQAMLFPVTLSATAPFPVTVAYTTTDVTAVAGIDYLASTGTLTFTPDSTGQITTLTQYITVTILPGTNRQLDKQFALNVAGTSGATTGNPSQVEGTIVTNAPPAINAVAASITESLTGTALLPFQVEVGPSLTGPVTVNYATADGTAVAGVDYQAVSGSLTLAPGRIQQTVFVPVFRQFLSELDKTLSFTISDPSVTIQLVSPTVTGTIHYLPVTTLPISRTQKAIYTDTLGQKVTVGLSGPGAGTIVFLGSDSVATNAYELSFSGTTAASNVSVSVAGTGQTTVNGIVVDGSLNALSGKAVNVQQGVVNISGTVNSLALGYLSSSAVTLGGTAGGRAVSVNIRRAVDTPITSGAPIRSLVAGAYVDTTPATPVYITAPSVGTVRVAGNFGGTIRASGIVAALQVGGSLTGGIEAGQGIGSVIADSITGAVLTAGTDGQASTVATTAFANANARIGRVQARSTFSNSLIAGSHVGRVTMGSVDSSASGTLFGIVGNDIASVKTVTTGGAAVNVANPKVQFKYQDFEVNLV